MAGPRDKEGCPSAVVDDSHRRSPVPSRWMIYSRSTIYSRFEISLADLIFTQEEKTRPPLSLPHVLDGTTALEIGSDRDLETVPRDR